MICVILVLYDGFFFFFKQKTAYEMRISDWSSDVCSSDLRLHRDPAAAFSVVPSDGRCSQSQSGGSCAPRAHYRFRERLHVQSLRQGRSEEHTSELQSLMRISYAVLCLKKKISDNTSNPNQTKIQYTHHTYASSSHLSTTIT